MERNDVDARLAGAYKEIYFADGDGNRVWNGAKKCISQKRTPLRWAIPLAAAVAVLLTVGAAVPQARAAMVTLYYQTMSIFDYLGMDKTDRPDNTAAASLVQGNVPAKLTVTAQPGGGWVKKLGFSFNDVLFDGKYIYLKYTMDPKGMKNFMTTPSINVGQMVYFEEYESDTLSLNGIGQPVLKEDDPVYMENGIVSDVAQFDTTGLNLSGNVSGSLLVDFYNSSETQGDDNNGTGNRELAGTIEVRFSFDTTEGRKLDKEIDLSGDKHVLGGETVVTADVYNTNKMVTSTNQKISLEGCSVAVDTVSVKPTGIDVRIHFYASARLSVDECAALCGPLSPELSGDGKEITDLDKTWTMDRSGNGFTIDCSIPMEYVGKIHILTVGLSAPIRAAAITRTAEPSAPASAPCPTASIYDGKYKIPGASFDIDLTK
jgi:hypothetical protein